jgi:hypothetical protein
MAKVLDSTAQYLLASLRALGRRHAVLAGNLANAHTPGYTRVDVDFGTTLRALYEEASPDGVPAAGVAFLRSDGTEPDPELEAAELSRTAPASHGPHQPAGHEAGNAAPGHPGGTPLGACAVEHFGCAGPGSPEIAPPAPGAV